jgi:hypothetical protein
MVTLTCWQTVQIATTFASHGVNRAVLWAYEVEMPAPRRTLLERLDPSTRAKLLMALLALILLGITLLAVVCIGARYVRRMGATTKSRATTAPTRQNESWKPRESGNVEDHS